MRAWLRRLVSLPGRVTRAEASRHAGPERRRRRVDRGPGARGRGRQGRGGAARRPHPGRPPAPHRPSRAPRPPSSDLPGRFPGVPSADLARDPRRLTPGGPSTTSACPTRWRRPRRSPASCRRCPVIELPPLPEGARAAARGRRRRRCGRCAPPPVWSSCSSALVKGDLEAAGHPGHRGAHLPRAGAVGLRAVPAGPAEHLRGRHRPQQRGDPQGPADPRGRAAARGARPRPGRVGRSALLESDRAAPSHRAPTSRSPTPWAVSSDDPHPPPPGRAVVLALCAGGVVQHLPPGRRPARRAAVAPRATPPAAPAAGSSTPREGAAAPDAVPGLEPGAADRRPVPPAANVAGGSAGPHRVGPRRHPRHHQARAHGHVGRRHRRAELLVQGQDDGADRQAVHRRGQQPRAGSTVARSCPPTRGFNPASADSMLAACVNQAEDHKVFAALALVGFYGEGEVCMANKQTPTLSPSQLRRVHALRPREGLGPPDLDEQGPRPAELDRLDGRSPAPPPRPDEDRADLHRRARGPEGRRGHRLPYLKAKGLNVAEVAVFTLSSIDAMVGRGPAGRLPLQGQRHRAGAAGDELPADVPVRAAGRPRRLRAPLLGERLRGDGHRRHRLLPGQPVGGRHRHHLDARRPAAEGRGARLPRRPGVPAPCTTPPGCTSTRIPETRRRPTPSRSSRCCRSASTSRCSPTPPAGPASTRPAVVPRRGGQHRAVVAPRGADPAAHLHAPTGTTASTTTPSSAGNPNCHGPDGCYRRIEGFRPGQ